MAVLLFGGLWAVSLGEPVHPGVRSTEVVTIPRGAGRLEIGRLLQRQGLVRSAYAFAALATYDGQGGRLQAGEYALSPGMTLKQIVARVASGDVVVVHVTVPPGLDVGQIIARLAQSGLGSAAAFRAAMRDNGLVSGWLPPGSPVRWPVEGYLYPDTYSFTHSMTPHQIVAAMVARFRRQWTPKMTAAAGAEHLSVNQAVTLASIVEREGRLDSQRPAVAAVFLNRLRDGMRLQSDATVAYALHVPPGRRLTAADLRAQSPYNTYVVAGLPPGPIASPGPSSLQAVLHPATSPDLYFLARADGTLVFARTLAEQLANRRRYLGY